jgi:hypothetical protein
MAVAISSFTPIEVIFEIGICFRDFDEVFKGRRMKRGSSQIGMDHYAGGIDDPAESGLNLKLDLPTKEGVEAIKGEKRIL